MRRYLSLLMMSLLIGCSTGTADVAEPPPPEHPGSNFDQLGRAIKGIGGNDVTLYEGLPNQFWEPQVREKELKEKPTTDVAGHPVYEEPLPLEAADRDKLTALFSAPTSYRQLKPDKRCSGFHVDYCLEWKSAAGTSRALVSLECGEVELYGPEGKLYCDFSDSAVEPIRKILRRYTNNRPEPETSAPDAK